MFDGSPRPELLALLAAVKAEPDDDTPKLALADWLQEQDHASDRARGEYLRLLVAFDRLPPHDSDRAAARGQLRDLWKNYPAWLGPLPAAGFKCDATSVLRGLLLAGIDGPQLASKKALAAAGSEEYAWVGGLEFSRMSSQQHRRFVHSPLLESLIALRYEGCNVEAWAVEELANAPGAVGLKYLALNRMRVGHLGAAAIAGSPDVIDPREGPGTRCQLGALRELNLGGSDIGRDSGFKSLCDSPVLNNLRALDVSNTGLSIHAARAFAEGTGLPALTELNLGGTNHIGPDGTLILVHSPNTGRLRKLNLWSNGVADYGVEAICRRDHMCNLTHLDLSGNLLTNRAAAALAGAPQLKTLEELNLKTNGISGEGALALANAPHLGNLRLLNLSSNPIGAKAAAALRERFGGV
jgi:uncharacterized protein (TIGR02996 family)